MLPELHIDESSSLPIYRQLFDQIRVAIESGALPAEFRLPASREMAGTLGINRTTVSAAYELLESEGLIRQEVGRGSFVQPLLRARLNWDDLLASEEGLAMPPAADAPLSFAASRPSERLFPIEAFRGTLREIADSGELAAILQLGAPAGYGPLRRYLFEQARRQGVAGAADDLLITNGVQQGFDLLQRALAARGETVVVEDPVYPGLKNVFLRGGARVIGAPVGAGGVDLEALERIFTREHPRLVVVTPSFQNPTGTTLAAAARKALLALAQAHGVVVVENDLYGELGYEAAPPPPLKALDKSGDTVLLKSFSKMSFPGLRVGWLIGPRHLVQRLTELKQLSDIHSDQLAQAALLRFAASGRLEDHWQEVRRAGRERLRAVVEACERELPAGTRFTRPTGGMSLWVRLPEPLDAAALLERAAAQGVAYLPGRYFAVAREERGALRLSFAGLEPEEIRRGVAILGGLFREELAKSGPAEWRDAPAVV